MLLVGLDRSQRGAGQARRRGVRDEAQAYRPRGCNGCLPRSCNGGGRSATRLSSVHDLDLRPLRSSLGGVEHWDAPGVGNTFSWNTDYYGLLTTTVRREVTTSTLAFVSVTPATGWTAVVEKTGPPKIVVQYTNTGGGGGAAPNTLRFRTFFSVNPNSGRMAENITECVPAT
jgi:hypothetical protein